MRRQPTVSFDLPIQRAACCSWRRISSATCWRHRVLLHELLITRSRDDLILAAVVSAGGNYVFIAGNLPVTAMTGFIGNLQLIIFLGILYVVAADELIDNQLISDQCERVSQVPAARGHDAAGHRLGSFHD